MGPDLPPRLADPPALVAPASDDARLAELTVHALVGSRWIGVSAFDAPLRASGYGPLPRAYSGGGFALDISLLRWRFELALMYTVASAPSLLDVNGVSAAMADMGFYAGYDVLRWRGLTGFVLGGVGYSALMIDARDPHWSWIANQTQVTSDVSTVEQDIFTLGVQGGIEEIVPLGAFKGAGAWGLMLSLRGGYLSQIGDVGWMTTDSSKPVGGLPGVDLSGAWVGVGLGLGAYGGALRQAPGIAPP